MWLRSSIVLLCLWHGPASAAPMIQPLAWELPYAEVAALKEERGREGEREREREREPVRRQFCTADH